MNAETSRAGQRLATLLIEFFAKRAYRFLLVLLIGAALMVLGGVMCYRELLQGLPDSKAGLYCSIGCFAVYAAAAAWYYYRIRKSTWQQVWLALQQRVGRRS